MAQQTAPATAREGCDTAKTAQPATPAETGADAGSKNIGATGWSGGGLGGSHTETSHSGPSAESRTAQPETASGLDPSKPERTARTDRCE